MRRFILIFTLIILFLSFFAAFLYLAKNNKNTIDTNSPEPAASDSPENSNPIEQQGKGPSTYEPYLKETYDSALSDSRVVVLYFTANWSEECRLQEGVNSQLIAALTDAGVVGLSVHILDSEATLETKALAQKFSVSKEDTIIVLDAEGAVYFRQTGGITSEVLTGAIDEALKKTISKEVIAG
jgi:thioredoxin-related protein